MDWPAIGTSLGTIVLAVATIILARTTANTVKRATQDRELSELPLLSIDLIFKPAGKLPRDQSLASRRFIQVVNVGQSPAFNVRIEVPHVSFVRPDPGLQLSPPMPRQINPASSPWIGTILPGNTNEMLLPEIPNQYRVGAASQPNSYIAYVCFRNIYGVEFVVVCLFESTPPNFIAPSTVIHKKLWEGVTFRHREIVHGWQKWVFGPEYSPTEWYGDPGISVDKNTVHVENSVPDLPMRGAASPHHSKG